MTAEDEKRRKERRERREREKAEGKTEQKDSQGRSVPSSKPRSSKKGPHLDVIDKLDSAGSFLDPFGGGASPRPIPHVKSLTTSTDI